jgi:hypothetical protein
MIPEVRVPGSRGAGINHCWCGRAIWPCVYAVLLPLSMTTDDDVVCSVESINDLIIARCRRCKRSSA